MKKIIFSIFLVVLLACSPKLTSTIDTTLPSLPENELVVVLEMIDNKTITGKKVGELKASDGGFSENCTYYENIANLKSMARKVGANLIKITELKVPDKWSTCHRLKASIYKVDNAKIYETEIEWSADRKLTWADFKGQPDLVNFPNALAVTNSGFGYEAGVNLFKEGKVFVRSVFNKNLSWVLPEGRTDFILKHEQIHFDITEIYSRKLRKELADAKITSKNATKAKPIFDKVWDELQKRQAKYDRETQRGSKKETQENWEAIVTIELAKYDFYKKNK